MQQVMQNSRKVILDTPEGSSPVIYLPLPDQAKNVVKKNDNDDDVMRQLREEALKKAQESATVTQNTQQDQSSSGSNRTYPPLQRNSNGYGQR